MSDTETTKPAPSAGESALGAVKGLVEEHPVAMLAGGIMLGALIAGAMARPAKDTAEGKPRRSFGRRAVQIAAFGAELAAAYAAGADSVVEEAPEPAPSKAPETTKDQPRRLSRLAATALRTVGPVLTRRLGLKTKD
jgi:hypothetical protein